MDTKDNFSNESIDISDIETTQNEIIELRMRIASKEVPDPTGKIKSALEDLERSYDEIKLRARRSKVGGEQALIELKKGFITAWKELKKAAENAKNKIESSFEGL